MIKIKISDSEENRDVIKYVREAITANADDLLLDKTETDGGKRVGIVFTCRAEYSDFIRCQAENAIADAIAVKYKYDYFGRNLKPFGLDKLQTEILYAALISADIEDDERYITRKIRVFDEYAIDGIFNFRLAALKRKWSEIVGYIPTYFNEERLRDFVGYLVGEKKGRKARVENGEVFAPDFGVLKRTELAGGSGIGRIVREVILSACGEVDVATEIPEEDARYIKDYYGSRAKFLYLKR